MMETRKRILSPFISKLTLTDFRNYDSLSLDLRPGTVVFNGDNGAGKTNLLEAISFLTPGRGLRRAPYIDVAREGSSGAFVVHASIEGPLGDVDIGTGTAPEAVGAAGRRVRINGAAAKSADDMLEWLRIVWLTPSMDSLFIGSASDRRRFLDRMVLAIDTVHGQRALDYEKAMRGRNRLLSEDRRDHVWFEAIETQMAETGAAIAAARVEMVRLLTATIGHLPETGPFPQADLTLSGKLEESIGHMPAVEIEEHFRRALAETRERDRVVGRTLDGPHRSDLLVSHRQKSMSADICSTGEQKALLVSIIISHARLTGEIAGAAPILLLDEIAAHLDASRRAALFAILEDLNCQTFMTGTDSVLFSGLNGKAQFMTVDHGSVRPN